MEDASAATPEGFVASPFGPTAIGKNEAVALDRDALKLLASDTRLDILKALRARRMTVSELSSSLALGKSTVFEHVNKLVDGGLVIRHDDPAREWVYYELAPKARKLFSPVSAKVVLMLSSVLGLALAALLAWSLAGTAAGGLHVDASPGEALAGEAAVYVVGVETSDGVGYAGADAWLLDADRYAEFRDGTAPPGSPLTGVAGDAPGRLVVRTALPAGDFHFVAATRDGELASRDGSGLVRVTRAEIHADPSPLIVGADEGRPVKLWLTHDGGIVKSGTLRVDGTSARFHDRHALAVENAIVTTRMDLLFPGDASFRFKPSTEGSFYEAVEGVVPVEMPETEVAPDFLVEGQKTDVTVTVWHGARGAIPDAPVRVVVDDLPLDQLYREPDATAATDARGVALVPVHPREPGQVRVYVGDLLVARLPVVKQVTVATATTSLGLEIWVEDAVTRARVPNALVEVDGDAVGTTDIHGHALVERRGGVIVRADGYAPYGVSALGWEAPVVHWVSGPAPPEGTEAPVEVTQIAVDAEDARVRAGSIVHLTAVFSNPSHRAVLERAVLTVDGARWSEQDVALAPGEVRAVEFPVLLREAGVHRLSVNEASVFEVTVVPQPSVQSAGAFESFDTPMPWPFVLVAGAAAAVLARRR